LLRVAAKAVVRASRRVFRAAGCTRPRVVPHARADPRCQRGHAACSAIAPIAAPIRAVRAHRHVTDGARLPHNPTQTPNQPPPVMKLIVRWLLLAAALLLVAHLSPGVTVNSFGAALVAALVLGLLNTLVRPLLVLLTLPVTVLTLGLFLFVINALMFWAAAGLLDGFHVNGFGSALIGSVIYSIASTIIDVAIEHLFEE
jgi:putative membrane protein